MALTSRTKEMLKLLLQRPVRIKDLTHTFEVCSRTVKYDIERIRFWLKDHEIELRSNPQKGIWIEATWKQIQQIRQLLDLNLQQELCFLASERAQFLFFELLLSDSYRTIQTFVDLFGVSRSTVSIDLEKVEKFCFDHQLLLERKVHKGLRILGTERMKRLALEQVLSDLLDQVEMYEILRVILNSEQEPELMSGLPVPIQKLNLGLKDVIFILRSAGQLVRSLRTRFQILIQDQSVISFVLRIFVVVNRIRTCSILEDDLTNEHPPHPFLANHLNKLFQDLHLNAVPQEEIQYAVEMITSGMDQTQFASIGFEHDAYRYTQNLVQLVAHQLNLPVDQDRELVNHLFAHLEDKLPKLKLGIHEPNPLAVEIMRTYRSLFLTVKESASQTFLSQEIQLKEHEIAYLVLHFQAAIERLKEHSFVRILVVCGTGRGNAQFIRTQLERTIKQIQVVGCCSYLDTQTITEMGSFDMIVSVVPLPLQISSPIIYVNPLPSAADLRTISLHVELLLQNKPLGTMSSPVSNFIQTTESSNAAFISKQMLYLGYELSQKVICEFKDCLNHQSEEGLRLHLLLLAHRITFGQLYQDRVISADHAQDEKLGANDWQSIIKRLQTILKSLSVELPPAELNAILRYLTIIELQKPNELEVKYG